MKLLIPLFLLFGLHTLSAQTELINHKSHSGTNRNYKVIKGSGNFGLSPVMINAELEKDNTSSYKLIFNEEGNSVQYILFKTKNKALDKTMCMASDEIIETISLSRFSNLRPAIVKILIAELSNYRKLEKQ
ncbi:hypothetical protein BH09BAC1_BH09BAC1_26520 [soil metagenome]